MSTIEIVLLWCVVSYAIAMAMFIRLPDPSKAYDAEDNRWWCSEEDSVAFLVSPVFIPVMTVIFFAKAMWLFVSSMRGKNENES